MATIDENLIDTGAPRTADDERVDEIQELRRQFVAWQREADAELERRAEVLQTRDKLVVALQRDLDELRERLAAAEAGRDEATATLAGIESSGSYRLSRWIGRVMAKVRFLLGRRGR